MTKRQIKTVVAVILALVVIRAGAILIREACAMSTASQQRRDAGDVCDLFRAQIAGTEALCRMWEAVPLAGGALRDLALTASDRDELLESLRRLEEITASIEANRRYLE